MAARSVSNATPSSLFSAWQDVRRASPHLRSRAAAAALSITEAELVAARCDAGQATRLKPAPADILAHVARLGRVRARSESRYASLESVGEYAMPDIGEHTGIVIGDNIDLRIFPSGWTYAYGVTDEAGGAPSVQIFDGNGAAAHKVLLRPESDVAAYERLVADLAMPSDAPLVTLAPISARAEKRDADVDSDAYRHAFAAMGDTHDFFMLLRRFGLAREQGLRLAEPEFARPLARLAHRQLFACATAGDIPLMLFVANEGIVQISSGLVPASTGTAGTYGMRDAHFDLQLDEDGVARAWAVRKPTVNGIVTSLELYDAAGTLIVQAFGERHEGSGERPDWARAIAELPSR